MDGGTAGTDGVDGDVTSINGTTVLAGDSVDTNAQLDILASRVWAMVFTVKIDFELK